MPGREIVLATNEIYHVFNKGVTGQPTFLTKKDYQRVFNTLFYYQNAQPLLRYSYFIVQSLERKKEILTKLQKEHHFLVEILAFCFLPNHFHLLTKQLVENGISQFLSNFTNSYTRYFNTKTKRNGPLFQGKFKAVRVESEEQLLHLSRYLHLNPYTSYRVKGFEDLLDYPYSSLQEYLERTKTNFCQKDLIFNFFKNSPKRYQKFLVDQADYQRRLGEIKHLIFES